MIEFSQGDIIKISGFKNKFMIVSKNSFIKATNVFHVCPIIEGNHEGPIHIFVEAKNSIKGTVICEQMKLIDPAARACSKLDHIPYDMIMNVSDAIQGIFEYD